MNHNEAYLSRTTIQAADEVTAMLTTGASSARIASHLGYQTRVVNRIAVPYLTSQGKTVKQISAQLGINERNVKAHRANHRNRLNEMSVDSAGKSST